MNDNLLLIYLFGVTYHVVMARGQCERHGAKCWTEHARALSLCAAWPLLQLWLLGRANLEQWRE